MARAEREAVEGIPDRHRSYGKRLTRGKAHIPGPSRSPEELHWREAVLLRDNYKCVWCEGTQRLEADHIKPKSLFPDLKYEVSNGRTLCHSCHIQTETYGGKVKKLAGVEVEDV